MRVRLGNGRKSRRQAWTRKTAPKDGEDAGYAAVDAIVALMILALGLILSLQAVTQARHAAAMAWEVRRAHSLLTHLMESAPRSFDEQQGDSDGFSWRVQVQLTGAERPVEVCRRATTLTNIRSGRTYAAATLEACPPADPA